MIKFDREYEEIGSSGKGLILKNSGKVKILWGNKFIDLLDSNGNLNVKIKAVIKEVDSLNRIKDDGFYFLNGSLFAKVGDNLIELTSESGKTYVSFLIELNTTKDEKYLALKNIGLVYPTLEDSNIYPKNGIIYIEDSQSLFIVNDGVLSKYTAYIPSPYNKQFVLQKEDSTEDGALVIEGLGISNSLLFDTLKIYIDNNAAIYDANTQHLFRILNKSILDISTSGALVNLILSYYASENLGYRIYKNSNGDYVLDIDELNVRNGIEHKKLDYERLIYSERYIVEIAKFELIHGVEFRFFDKVGDKSSLSSYEYFDTFKLKIKLIGENTLSIGSIIRLPIKCYPYINLSTGNTYTYDVKNPRTDKDYFIYIQKFTRKKSYYIWLHFICESVNNGEYTLIPMYVLNDTIGEVSYTEYIKSKMEGERMYVSGYNPLQYYNFVYTKYFECHLDNNGNPCKSILFGIYRTDLDWEGNMLSFSDFSDYFIIPDLETELIEKTIFVIGSINNEYGRVKIDFNKTNPSIELKNMLILSGLDSNYCRDNLPNEEVTYFKLGNIESFKGGNDSILGMYSENNVFSNVLFKEPKPLYKVHYYRQGNIIIKIEEIVNYTPNNFPSYSNKLSEAVNNFLSKESSNDNIILPKKYIPKVVLEDFTEIIPALGIKGPLSEAEFRQIKELEEQELEPQEDPEEVELFYIYEFPEDTVLYNGKLILLKLADFGENVPIISIPKTIRILKELLEGLTTPLYYEGQIYTYYNINLENCYINTTSIVLLKCIISEGNTEFNYLMGNLLSPTLYHEEFSNTPAEENVPELEEESEEDVITPLNSTGKIINHIHYLDSDDIKVITNVKNDLIYIKFELSDSLKTLINSLTPTSPDSNSEEEENLENS